MQFPLSFWDISLWLAITSIILLVTSELLSLYYGHINIIIDRKKMRTAALTLGVLFILTVFIRIYLIMALY
jgi:hypothetical protein